MLQKEGMNLTAVTVAVENGHTVAFLGTSDGKILKVNQLDWKTGRCIYIKGYESQNGIYKISWSLVYFVPKERRIISDVPQLCDTQIELALPE